MKEISTDFGEKGGLQVKRWVRSLGAVCCVLGMFCCFVSAAAPDGAATFRIATWNILHGNDQLDAQRELLAEVDADLVALQEVDRYTDRVDGKNCLWELGRGKYTYRYFSKFLDYQEGDYGIGLLSNKLLREVVSDFSDAVGASLGEVIRATVLFGGRQISVYNVHLSWNDEAYRTWQIEQLWAIWEDDPCPRKIILGDFNVSSFDQYGPFLEEGMVSTPWNPQNTYHGFDWTTQCIDNIIYTADTLQLDACEMVEVGTLSDHNLLAADFQLKEPTVHAPLAPQETAPPPEIFPN